MHRYAVTIIHYWCNLDGGEINYPGETTILDTFPNLAAARAAADHARAEGKDAVVIDQEHVDGPRRI